MEDFETPVRVRYERTDDGNASQFADVYCDEITYVPETENWRRWDGIRWASDEGDAALYLARELVRGWPTFNETAAKWRSSCLNANRLTSMVRLARTAPIMRTSVTDFDTDPYLLNTPSGILNLKTLELMPHSSIFRMTRITAVPARKPKADAWSEIPRFQEFMRFITKDDPELIHYFQVLGGLILIGEVREHILPFFYGSGGNGKGTFLELLLAILGTVKDKNYAVALKEGFLTSTDSDNYPFEMATLFGARLAVHPETQAESKFNEARVKQTTGGDSINAAFKHRDEFTFKPSHTMIIQGNNRPGVSAGGDGFWRRLQEVPFDNKITRDTMDTRLKDKLLDEGPYILWWMAEGAKEYIDSGKLSLPARVVHRTEQYSGEEDIYQAFLSQYCLAGEDFKVSAKDLYAAFASYLHDNGEKPITSTEFGRNISDPPGQPPKRTLSGIGISKKRAGDGLWYLGIRLRPSSNDLEM